MSFKFWQVPSAKILLKTTSIALLCWFTSPVQAQIPILPNWHENINLPNLLNIESEDLIVSGCILLDGRCLFKITAYEADLSERLSTVQQRLDDIINLYFQNPSSELQIRKQSVGSLEDIYIQVNDTEERLLTVTDWDAALSNVTISVRAEQIVDELNEGILKAKKERQSSFLIRQGIITFVILAFMLLSSIAISGWEKHSIELKKQLTPSNHEEFQSIFTRLTLGQKWNIKEVQCRLLQVSQLTIWSGGSLLILGLFPYTRIIQLLAIISLRIPSLIVIVFLITYVTIRLTYAFIDYCVQVFASNALITPSLKISRSYLRISTISQVIKNIITGLLIMVGFLIILVIIGINIAPLLAGVGIIGLGLSLASQQVIKDIINGFLIILEDQYAVGDAIRVGEVEGIVENVNVRITQLRDAGGRLITIPNGEIKIVANLSNEWARADLNIPIAYQSDLTKALNLIDKVIDNMSDDPNWQEQILEDPEVLGVENFELRGVIIRIWIKTLPLRQWHVSRELRRRLKIAFDEAGIMMSLPQQQLIVDNYVEKEKEN